MQIGGTWTIPPPPFFIVPAYSIQDNGVIISSGRGKWVTNLEFYFTSATGATTFVFPDIEGSTGNFMGSVPSTITSLSAPQLVFCGSNIVSAAPATLSSLTTISLPRLYTVSQMLQNMTTPALVNLDLSSLVYVVSGIGIIANALPSLSLPSVKYLASLTLQSTSVASISIPSIVTSGTITITAASCTSLTLPALGVWKMSTGNFTVINAALNQTSVDNILAALAYMDGNNGTVSYSAGRSVLLGGTSAAPTNLGSTTTAGSNFVGAGTTCTVNLTAHGYATDDVLRISGITTLTNANRYARITVVNANQFTYTITSQTATGAGTATIVKAGASAKALVTRGVSLTTN